MLTDDDRWTARVIPFLRWPPSPNALNQRLRDALRHSINTATLQVSIDKNRTRLTNFQFDRVEASAVRIQLNDTYGSENVKLFEVRCYESK